MKISINLFYTINILALLIAMVCAVIGVPFYPWGLYVVGTSILSFIVFLILLYLKRIK